MDFGEWSSCLPCYAGDEFGLHWRHRKCSIFPITNQSVELLDQECTTHQTVESVCLCDNGWSHWGACECSTGVQRRTRCPQLYPRTNNLDKLHEYADNSTIIHNTYLNGTTFNSSVTSDINLTTTFNQHISSKPLLVSESGSSTAKSTDSQSTVVKASQMSANSLITETSELPTTTTLPSIIKKREAVEPETDNNSTTTYSNTIGNNGSNILFSPKSSENMSSVAQGDTPALTVTTAGNSFPATSTVTTQQYLQFSTGNTH